MAVSRDLELGSNSGGSNMGIAALTPYPSRRAEADGDGAAVRVEALGGRQRHGGGRQGCQRAPVELEDRGALHEVEHAEPRGEAGAAGGRQHVVGARHVVADHLRRMRAQEDGAGIADACGELLGVAGGDLEMLGGDAVGKARGLVQGAQQDHGAEGLPAGAGDVAARQHAELALDGGCDALGEAGVVGHQDGLGGGVVLGLGQQVGGEPLGVVVPVGDDEDLRRSGDGIDADRAEHLALGGRDVGIAGADDLGDGRHALGAVGQRGHGLRAADAIDLGDAGQVRGRQHQRVHLAARRGHGHGDARHAGNAAPAPRSSAPSLDSWRARPARRGRPTRSPSSASRARRRAHRCSGRRSGSWRRWWALDARRAPARARPASPCRSPPRRPRSRPRSRECRCWRGRAGRSGASARRAPCRRPCAPARRWRARPPRRPRRPRAWPARKAANALSKSGSAVVRCRGMARSARGGDSAASRVSRWRRIVVGMLAAWTWRARPAPGP